MRAPFGLTPRSAPANRPRVRGFVVTNRAVTRSDDDVRLVDAALCGQSGAREQLAHRLVTAIHRQAAVCVLRWTSQRGVPARQSVNDLTQDVLVGLFEHDARVLRRWDPELGSSLDTFVCLVARRRVARVLGREHANPAAGPEQVEAIDEQSLTSRLEGRAVLNDVLRELQAQMNERDLELFDLLFVQGFDPEEVSARLEMTRGAVNAWTYRTRKLARAIASRQVHGQRPKENHNG